jgi:hypothetical protein
MLQLASRLSKKRAHGTASSDVPAIMGGLFELLEHNTYTDRPTHGPQFLLEEENRPPKRTRPHF